MRADQLLVERGLAPTRSAAQRLIAHRRRALARAGRLARADARRAKTCPSGAELEITDDAELRFVSRGGLKLDGALARLGLDVAGMTCLDLGQSTGGFTDALLQRGATHVVGVDVGHGQLHPRLAADPRVTALEGVNARHLEAGAAAGRALRPDRRRPLVHLADAGAAGARAAARRRPPAAARQAAVRAAAGRHRQGGQVKTRSGLRPRREAPAQGLRDARPRRARLVRQRHAGGEGAREFFLHAVRAGQRGATP